MLNCSSATSLRVWLERFRILLESNVRGLTRVQFHLFLSRHADRRCSRCACTQVSRGVSRSGLIYHRPLLASRPILNPDRAERHTQASLSCVLSSTTHCSEHASSPLRRMQSAAWYSRWQPCVRGPECWWQRGWSSQTNRCRRNFEHSLSDNHHILGFQRWVGWLGMTSLSLEWYLREEAARYRIKVML